VERKKKEKEGGEERRSSSGDRYTSKVSSLPYSLPQRKKREGKKKDGSRRTNRALSTLKRGGKSSGEENFPHTRGREKGVRKIMDDHVVSATTPSPSSLPEERKEGKKKREREIVLVPQTTRPRLA